MLFWIIIGIAFYNLAKMYGKNKFVYLGIGIGLTLLVQLITGFVYALVAHPTEEELKSDLVVNLIAVLISGIVTYLVYRSLKNKAEKEYWAEQETINSFGAEIIERNKERNIE